MQQGCASEPNLLHQLLTLAGRASIRLDAILEFSLEKALYVTSSDVGGVILFFDTSGKGPLIKASGLAGKTAEHSRILRELTGRPSGPAPRSDIALPSRVDDYRSETETLPLFLRSHSSLRVPLIDARRVVGVIQVESSRAGHYRDTHLQKLKALANQVQIAVARLCLKEDAAKSGARVDVIGVSPAFLELERQIKLAATYEGGPVIITGERGSGKELTAWALHCWSRRRRRPFVPVLTSSFSEGLFVDELFGHERHAFTGAVSERMGKFKAADGGTIFLDEVADMPMSVQTSLLRIIESGELSRIGRDLPMRVNVRVVAATNRDLPAIIRQGRFRQDLYDRLRVFEIRVPPLRERIEDIAPLASHFVRSYCADTERHLRFEDRRICSTRVCTEALKSRLMAASGLALVWTSSAGRLPAGTCDRR